MKKRKENNNKNSPTPTTIHEAKETKKNNFPSQPTSVVLNYSANIYLDAILQKINKNHHIITWAIYLSYYFNKVKRKADGVVKQSLHLPHTAPVEASSSHTTQQKRQHREEGNTEKRRKKNNTLLQIPTEKMNPEHNIRRPHHSNETHSIQKKKPFSHSTFYNITNQLPPYHSIQPPSIF